MIPAPRILFVQRLEDLAARRTPRLAQRQQRVQPQRLGLVGQMGRDEFGQEHRLGGELARRGVVDLAPVQRVGAVDRLQHGREALRPFARLGLLEAQAGGADLGLGAHEALGHRLRLDEEGAGDAGGVQAEHGLQHQCAVHAGVDRRMRADEHQAQPRVGQCGRLGRGGVLVGPQHSQRRVVGQALAAGGDQQLAARGGQQPCVGRGRHAVARPVGERAGEGLGKRVLGRRDIAPLPGQPREQPAVAAPRGGLGRGRRVDRWRGRRGVHFAGAGMGRTGHAKVVPTAEPGQRSAHLSASSSESTSISA